MSLMLLLSLSLSLSLSLDKKIIEKRRRDRINHSLSELRRLVPSAFEKQVSVSKEKGQFLVGKKKNLEVKGVKCEMLSTLVAGLIQAGEG